MDTSGSLGTPRCSAHSTPSNFARPFLAKATASELCAVPRTLIANLRVPSMRPRTSDCRSRATAVIGGGLANHKNTLTLAAGGHPCAMASRKRNARLPCGTFTMSALVCQLLCVLLRHVVDGVELRLCMPFPDSARVSCRVERRLRLPLEVRKDLLREQLCRTSGVLRVRPIVTHL